MKLKKLKFAALATAVIGVVGGVSSAVANTSLVEQVAPETAVRIAQTFGNTPVNENNFLLVSVPGGSLQPHRLFIIEQMQPSPACFEVMDDGSLPIEVNDLWNQFDYTGVCRVQKDSNGFAVWIGGEDVGLEYRLQVVERNGNLLLQARPSQGKTLTVGTTGGISSTGFTKINLNDGWYLTKRTFEGSIVGSHLVYLTNDATIAQLEAAEGGDDVAVTPTPTPTPTPTTPPQTPPFTDIQGDIYAAQIARAAQLGITSGYEDGTFKPLNTISREEAVTLVMETIVRTAPASVQAQLPQQVFGDPFPDVSANRWSALRIAQAKQLGIIEGDFETGNFRPGDPLTRAELMALSRKAALARNTEVDALTPNQTPMNFSDISGHWAAATIVEMSGYCGVATPLNERGSNFAPENDALRNYAVTAMVRIVDCPARQQGI